MRRSRPAERNSPIQQETNMSTLAKPALVLGLALLAAITCMTPAYAAQLDGAQYLKNAKVKLAAARTIALKVVVCDATRLPSR